MALRPDSKEGLRRQIVQLATRNESLDVAAKFAYSNRDAVHEENLKLIIESEDIKTVNRKLQKMVTELSSMLEQS